ncbi:MAG TPA: LLM class flavin-dependent oxidoreductase [Acidimicrobiales bacterium]|nr:LLM class flavin-dependent oxidoreductase [Acidimicrobiales bacterium]
MTVELWTSGVGLPRSTVRQARRAEDEGWHGIGLVDSQNLAGDPYVELALAAGATTTLQLATAVTNPVTRHPAVAATAIATVQGESGGRAVLGIGRGDSALAHLGLSPAPVSVFERYLERLQGYLRGGEVEFDVATDGAGGVRSSSALGMAGGPTSSRVRWIRPGQPKVPVDVAATGPKVIAAGARHAERVTFAVGVSPERIEWAVDLAVSVRADVELGAYVPLLVHPDRDEARRLIAGSVGSYARFSVMHGSVAGPVSDSQRERLVAVHHAYDMGAHFSHGSPQSQELDDDVIDAFGIAGPPGYCVEKLLELEALGIRRVFVMGAGIGLDREEASASRARFVAEVLPAVRG